MGGRAISVRLDRESEQALEELTRTGRSRSDAIRDSLVEAARRQGDTSLAAEARRLAGDPDDLEEMAGVAALMESLRAEG